MPEAGSVSVLLGRNETGRTTTLRTIARLNRATVAGDASATREAYLARLS